MPGVYMQGLLIYNGDGSIMHEESLSKDLVRETIKLAKELGNLQAQQIMPDCEAHVPRPRGITQLESSAQKAMHTCMSTLQLPVSQNAKHCTTTCRYIGADSKSDF